MKKIMKIWSVVALFIAISIGMVNVAYGASGTLTGPEVVRSGNSITLIAGIDVAGISGLECTVNYDTSVCTLISVKAIMDGWMAEVNNNTIVAYDNNLSNPTTSSSKIMMLEFDIKDEVAAGTAVNISLSNIVLTDGTTEVNLSDMAYTVAISKPLSKNNKLSGLSIKEGTLSPAFKTSVTSYDAGTVEYSVSSLTIETITEDPNAKVSIKGNELKVGNNLITITVTSESGSQKVYTISVKRKQDPDYVAGADATLKEIKLSSGTLSPNFSPSITEYIVYVPYEVTSISAVGTANDKNAIGVTNGSINKLKVGENEMTVVCKAEDGSEKVYTITVKRMPKYGEEEETTVPEETTVYEDDEQDTTTQTATDVNGSDNDQANTKEDDSSHILWYIIFFIIGAGIGYALCMFIMKKRYDFQDEEIMDEEAAMAEIFGDEISNDEEVDDKVSDDKMEETDLNNIQEVNMDENSKE